MNPAPRRMGRPVRGRDGPHRFEFRKGNDLMHRGRKRSRDLSYRDKKIINRLNTSSEPMSKLAKRYGVSKQRIHQILAKAKDLGYVVHRPRPSARLHEIPQCEVCGKILKVSEKDSLITRRQLSQMLNVEYRACIWHLNQLRISGLVSKNFVTMRSDRLANAIRYYRFSSLSPSAVGKKFGYKNFYSLLSYQKKRGVEVERSFEFPASARVNEEGHTTAPPSVSSSHS